MISSCFLLLKKLTDITKIQKLLTPTFSKSAVQNSFLESECMKTNSPFLVHGSATLLEKSIGQKKKDFFIRGDRGGGEYLIENR
jgi:hypothetical protein